jgi:hypothetical protein
MSRVSDNNHIREGKKKEEGRTLSNNEQKVQVTTAII